MAKKAKKVKTAKGAELRIVNPDAAGIDIADGIMQVCVPADRSKDNNRAFGAYTSDLHAISAWLRECGIKTVAMESTGVYWIPLFCRLQEDGLDVVLTNARDVKNITERKTDESDAEWLMLLHQYGLLKASFQPHNDAKRMRTLTRHRDTLSREASSIVLRMQKAMQQMNIKLTLVLSDITGKSGIRIIEAILAGERDPKRLADLADIQCKTPKEEIAKALEGNWEEDLMFVLRQNYDTFKIIVPNLASAMQNWRNSWKTTVRRLPKWKILHIARQKNAAIIKRPGIPWASTWKGKHTKCGE